MNVSIYASFEMFNFRRIRPGPACAMLGPLLCLLATGCLVGVVGCANREAIGRLSSEPLPTFSDSGPAEMSDRWWTAFGDAELNARVQQAFGGNYDLAAALQRVSAARAVARRQASDFFPDVNGVATAGGDFGPGDDDFPSVIGLDASYIVDLWGQIDALVDAERLRASATYADYQTIALAVSAEVTRTWLNLIEAKAQLELLDDQIETNRTGLDLQESRFGLGLVRSPDVLRQRQLLESTFEQYAVAKSRVDVLEHQLAILLGELPQTASYDPGTRLPDMPSLPRTGLPAELLNRRPDVRSAFLAFQAADRDVAAAITDQFPRLNLTGSVLNVADSPENLFRDWFVSIGGQLVAPLIDGGQRRAEVDRTTSVARLRYNEYGQTMLIAFGEVEDALAQERYQLERLEHLAEQTELARKSSEQLREQYLIGDEDYLAVLTAIQGWQRLQRESLAAQLELRLIRVSLYLALAGGFDPRGQTADTVVVSTEDVESPAPAESDPAATDSDAGDDDRPDGLRDDSSAESSETDGMPDDEDRRPDAGDDGLPAPDRPERERLIDLLSTGPSVSAPNELLNVEASRANWSGPTRLPSPPSFQTIVVPPDE
ncbi:Toluene efflux pump outer membrane protein TtgI precursor [Crateriforma conspicua]|nr:Toluene efflux pump outer membrane protein TtgI precursor [Crateriforma conspicua]